NCQFAFCNLHFAIFFPCRGPTLMRLATIQPPDQAPPRVVALRDDHYVDLQDASPLIPGSLRQLLAAGPEALRLAAELARRGGVRTWPAGAVKLLPPITDPQKIVCLGLNYRDHAAESGAPIPRDPVLFSKYATALVGHEGAIVLPAVSQEVDYEAELVFVVG